MKNLTNKHHNFGFTLIEVLLVILVVGLMVAAVQLNFNSNKPEAQLQQESARFASVFNLAAEYSLLNNLELGLYIQNNTYQFVGFDGVSWTTIPDNKLFDIYQLPDMFTMNLVFDDLPMEQPSLVSRELFQLDEDAIQDLEDDASDEQPVIIPQVYILSGGDITPFRMVFSFADLFDVEQDIAYAVTGLYSAPVRVSEPIINGDFSELSGESDAL
ncbi:type II secretion system minor pseudopilin GspH [Thalassotalea sp. G2M2-11]|uniref:type II secretion system minor pseudopilin GspH n=1 Tax=Thalassotalea sp. G2M2-11 TaxID=2787627 RepID=UPI0019D21FEB|nr:type II secretion system minor pseudopilin GspH [Thalassotalea sp. G2M2-11]